MFIVVPLPATRGHFQLSSISENISKVIEYLCAKFQKLVIKMYDCIAEPLHYDERTRTPSIAFYNTKMDTFRLLRMRTRCYLEMISRFF